VPFGSFPVFHRVDPFDEKTAGFTKPLLDFIHSRNTVFYTPFSGDSLCRVGPIGTEPGMASWQEIDRIRKDAKGFRSLAKGLRTHISDLTDWEKDFLTSINSQSEKEEFTTRQSEKLMQIRDDYEIVTQLPGGFSVRIILEKCKEGRIDLLEDEEEWIAQAYERSPTTIRRKHVGRLIRCARRLNLIENEYND
jgi:hypothetical protein